MRSSTIISTIISLTTSTNACLYFNATLSDNSSLTVYSWDDTNNNNATNPTDILCTATNHPPISPSSSSSHNNLLQWSIPCTTAANAKSNTTFDIFLDPITKRFLDIIYRYSNPDAMNLQLEGRGDERADEFYFNFRVGSVDGKFFKAREFCAQYDILRLVKPDALKNECDSLDTC